MSKKSKISKKIETVSNEVLKEDKTQKIRELLRSSGALFDTLDLEVYKQRLDNFSLNELYGEAERVGLKRGAERVNCTRAILALFNEYRSKFVPVYGGIETKVDLNDAKKAKILELMKDGRP